MLFIIFPFTDVFVTIGKGKGAISVNVILAVEEKEPSDAGLAAHVEWATTEPA